MMNVSRGYVMCLKKPTNMRITVKPKSFIFTENIEVFNSQIEKTLL